MFIFIMTTWYTQSVLIQAPSQEQSAVWGFDWIDGTACWVWRCYHRGGCCNRGKYPSGSPTPTRSPGPQPCSPPLGYPAHQGHLPLSPPHFWRVENHRDRRNPAWPPFWPPAPPIAIVDPLVCHPLPPFPHPPLAMGTGTNPGTIGRMFCYPDNCDRSRFRLITGIIDPDPLPRSLPAFSPLGYSSCQDFLPCSRGSPPPWRSRPITVSGLPPTQSQPVDPLIRYPFAPLPYPPLPMITQVSPSIIGYVLRYPDSQDCPRFQLIIGIIDPDPLFRSLPTFPPPRLFCLSWHPRCLRGLEAMVTTVIPPSYRSRLSLRSNHFQSTHLFATALNPPIPNCQLDSLLQTSHR